MTRVPLRRFPERADRRDRATRGVTRFLALLALHLLVSFALLPDNVAAWHPFHHDDYDNLSAGVRDVALARPRPVSTLAIAAVADLGLPLAYAAQNLLLVVCVALSLRFVELFVRDGRPLPWTGWVPAAAIAFAFPSAVDYTRYFGLLTNLASAAFGLGAMVAAAAMARRRAPARAGSLAFLALCALSFLSKEDFLLPILLTCAGAAASGAARRWLALGAIVVLMFLATLAMGRAMGSVFVTGTPGPADPYYISFAPGSLWDAFAAMMLRPAYPRTLLLAALGAVALAVLALRRDATTATRVVLLPAIALSLLAPYAIFPNHTSLYYAFLPATLLAAALAAAFHAPAADAPARTRAAGALLLGVAIAAVAGSYDARRDLARHYARHASYNRAIADFLAERRDALAGNAVAVHGLAGPSPWSNSTGAYLERFLGRRVDWHVFVPREDLFYRFGTKPGGTVHVHPAARACEIAGAPGIAHVVVGADGRARVVADCTEAMSNR